MKLQVSNKLYDISGKRNIRVDHLDGGNDKSESVGQSFFRGFVDKEIDEIVDEIDNNDLVITKEESNSRIIVFLSILGCIEFLISSALLITLIHPNMVEDDSISGDNGNKSK